LPIRYLVIHLLCHSLAIFTVSPADSSKREKVLPPAGMRSASYISLCFQMSPTNSLNWCEFPACVQWGKRHVRRSKLLFPPSHLQIPCPPCRGDRMATLRRLPIRIIRKARAISYGCSILLPIPGPRSGNMLISISLYGRLMASGSHSVNRMGWVARM